ncbi:hypothetical protein [Pseudonocardia sp. GCM10023141]
MQLEHGRVLRDAGAQRLMVLSADPGSPSHDALRILASWTADPVANG